MRADAVEERVRRRRPVLAVMVVAALAALALVGCGESSTRADVVERGSGSEVDPLTTEPLTTEPPTTGVAAPVESPGVDAELVVGALPDGWAYSREVHSKATNGDPVVINTYLGAPVDIKIPGGGQAHQTISVAAVWQPGYQASGNDLRSLISPQVWQDAGFLDATDAKVGSRPALLLTVKSPVPPGSSSVSPLDYTLMFAIGDWWVQLSGQAVDARTLSAVAQAVDVR